MDYTPRFSQPFTLTEVIGLDVAVITEEIARLQNSLAHLKKTQDILQADLNEPGESDPEITKALEENTAVIGSQEERISILKMALTEKGIVAGSHYDPIAAPQSTRSTQPATVAAPSMTTLNNDTEDEGVYL
ncbi:hypothetical protein BDZ97DRAFT_26214 [Flammula alnicola]|nr:hypothetical protein BDZ97DRAFT_26214 [Flammula alnicola]